MEFELSEELINTIIFSMEDQESAWVIDSAEKKLEKKTDISHSDDRYYILPSWDSISGFQLMERFVSMLHNPLAREELRFALASGRGVFRNFKNILKKYTEIERLWYTFKEKEMRRTVWNWYNGLREVWGLERIGEEPEEIEDIVHDDFNFRSYDEKKDEGSLFAATDTIINEIEQSHERGLGVAFTSLWARLRDLSAPESELLFIAETQTGDFAACISSCPLPENSVTAVVVTGLFVLPQYRGLGLAKEILHFCILRLAEKGFRWIIFAAGLIPRKFVQVLYRQGFRNVGSLFVLDLLNNPEVPFCSDFAENSGI